MAWKKIKQEYIRGGISYRQLAEKHGVSLRTLASRASEENWVQLRQQACNKTASKIVEKISDQQSESTSEVHDAALMLLEAFKKSVSAFDEDVMPPSVMKDYGSALRSIQTVLDSAPTKLDIEEQRARIDKLRKEASKDEQANEPITVTLEGVDDYAV